MAGEVSVARESGVMGLRAANAIGGSTDRAHGRAALPSQNPQEGRNISFNNGMGGTREMTLSDNREKNDAMKAISGKFTLEAGNGAASVNDYIRKTSDGYEVKVSNVTGQQWTSDKPYGKITHYKNNSDYILKMSKVRGRWRGTLTQRRYYGLASLASDLAF